MTGAKHNPTMGLRSSTLFLVALLALAFPRGICLAADDFVAGRKVISIRDGAVPNQDGYFVDRARARTNPNYQRILRWEPDAHRRKMLYSMVSGLPKTGDTALWILPDQIPTNLIQVNWGGDSYYIYEPCEGRSHSTRLQILWGDPSSIGVILEIHHSIESNAYPVREVLLKSGKKFELYRSKGNRRGRPIVTIEKIGSAPILYHVSITTERPGKPSDAWSFRATPISEAAKFALVMNRCNESKRVEFRWFSYPKIFR